MQEIVLKNSVGMRVLNELPHLPPAVVSHTKSNLISKAYSINDCPIGGALPSYRSTGTIIRDDFHRVELLNEQVAPLGFKFVYDPNN